MDETQVYKPIPYTGYEPPVVTQRVFPSQETLENARSDRKMGIFRYSQRDLKPGMLINKNLVGGEKYEFVSWDDDIPN